MQDKYRKNLNIRSDDIMERIMSGDAQREEIKETDEYGEEYNGDEYFNDSRVVIENSSRNELMVKAEYESADLIKIDGWYGIKSIVFPKHLKRIRYMEISNVSDISMIVIPDSIRSIEKLVISDCMELKDLIFEPEIEKIKELEIKKCYFLEKVKMPKNLCCCDSICVSHSLALKEMNIPECVKKFDISSDYFSKIEVHQPKDFSADIRDYVFDTDMLLILVRNGIKVRMTSDDFMEDTSFRRFWCGKDAVLDIEKLTAAKFQAAMLMALSETDNKVYVDFLKKHFGSVLKYCESFKDRNTLENLKNAGVFD